MKKSSKNILTAFILNFVFVIVEVIGGIFTNSVAILSDAIHDFGDCLAVGLAFVLEKKSDKKEDDIYTYGYKRYSIISALITNFILIIGGVIVLYSAIQRFTNPEPVKGYIMLGLAILGVIVNGAVVLKTWKSKSINERSISLHMLEDVLGWVVVLIGSIFITVFNVYIIDPIMSILVTLFIFYNVVKNLLQVFSVILEKAPKDFKMEEYKKEIMEIENILDLHHIHIWTIDGENLLATMHIVVKNDLTTEEMAKIKDEVKHESEHYKIKHLTMQIDLEGEVCETCDCNMSKLNCDSCEHHHHHH